MPDTGNFREIKKIMKVILKQRIGAWLLCLALWAGLTGSASAELSIPAPVQGAYWGLCSVEEGRQHLTLLQQHGLNTALVKDSEYVLSLELLRHWAAAAEARNLTLLPVINFAGPSEIKALQQLFRPYVDGSGRALPHTPCPLDGAYWNASIFERLAQLAHLAHSAPLAGAVFDSEMYGSDMRLYGAAPCFCDGCWHDFAQAVRPEAFSVAAEQRATYLREHHLDAAYAEFQQRQLRDLLRRLEAGVHAINPHFAIGFLAYRPNWFYRSLAQGLGTAAQPVLVFTETSYVRGYTADIAQEQREVLTAANPPAARYIPGIWLERFFPDDLPAQLLHIASHSDGYWLYTAASLWAHNRDSELYALHGEQDAYWQALHQSNQAIAVCLADPIPCQTPAFALAPSSSYDAERQSLVTPPSLLPMLAALRAAHPASTEQMRQPVITFRGKNLFHGLITDEAIAQQRYIGISHSPQGRYADPTQYTLFNREGSLLKQGRLTPESSAVNIILTPDMSNSFSLLVNSGLNACVVTLDGIPAVVEASGTFPLSTIKSAHTYDLYVRGEHERLRFSAYAADTEPAVLVVRSPDRRVDMQATIRGFSEFNIPIERPGETFWTLAITGTPYEAFEDVEVYLYNHEFPFLIINPDEMPSPPE